MPPTLQKCAGMLVTIAKYWNVQELHPLHPALGEVHLAAILATNGSWMKVST